MEAIHIFKRITQKDTWLLAAALFLIAAVASVEFGSFQNRYLLVLFFTLLFYTPILGFHWFKEDLKAHNSQWRFRLLWIFAFVIYPIVVSILNTIGNEDSLFGIKIPEDYLPIAGLVLFLVECGLLLQKFLARRIKKVNWIRHISLNKIILSIFGFITVVLSMVAVSNIDTFQGDLFDQGIKLREATQHFGSFIWFILQFALAFGWLYLIYWINRYLLIGQLLKNKGLLHFLLGGVATIGMTYPIASWIIAHLPISQNYMSILPSRDFNYLAPENGMVGYVVILLSTPIIIVYEWFGQNQKITALAKEKAEKELDFLKQQINPHFFFNTLNNLYALSLQKSQQTPEVIMQLADLMRYVIYKGKEELVMLREEIEYIEDYIQLQRIRQHQKLSFEWINEIDDDEIGIPPLLLIVLVENAFKHGVDTCEKDCYVRVEIKTKNESIFFSVTNTFDRDENHIPGIGLENLQRRLDILYPGRYDLEFQEESHIFKANLNLHAA